MKNTWQKMFEQLNDEELREVGRGFAAATENRSRSRNDTLQRCFVCLANLCEDNKRCITGESTGSESYWGSMQHWIDRGRELLASKGDSD